MPELRSELEPTFNHLNQLLQAIRLRVTIRPHTRQLRYLAVPNSVVWEVFAYSMHQRGLNVLSIWPGAHGRTFHSRF